MRTHERRTEADRESSKNPERAQSVGEGKKTHPRDDKKVLPRQTRNERGAVRGMQGAHGVRAFPPGKVPLQGQ